MTNKIMELADAYAAMCSEFAVRMRTNGDGSMSPIAVEAGDARSALCAALDAADRELEQLQVEVVNRNRRALHGDKATAQFNSMYDEIESLKAENAALRDALTKIATSIPAPQAVNQQLLEAARYRHCFSDGDFAICRYEPGTQWEDGGWVWIAKDEADQWIDAAIAAAERGEA